MTALADPDGRERVLVVESGRELRHLFEAILARPGRDVTVVGDRAAAEAALEAGDVDLIALELVLPDADGRVLLADLRQRPATADVPILVTTARATPAVRAECFRLGADALVEKPFDPESFAQDVDARLERSTRAAPDEGADPVTGLESRSGVLGAISDLPQGTPCAVLSIHVDGFHALVEEWGWTAAASFLEQLSAVMRSASPEGVTLGRTGGGEFVAVFADEHAMEGEALSRALVAAVRRMSLTAPDGESFRPTVSVGLARRSDDGSPPEALLERAERRAEDASRAGGNRLVAGQPEAEAPRPILVAEDDDITATILRHRLEKEGFDVVRYANGAEAYKAAAELRPALVLLDVKMPGMDGFELLERLRRMPSYARVPIVLLTSMGSESDVVRAFDLGADDYIPKPFSPAELVARLRRFLGRTEAAPV